MADGLEIIRIIAQQAEMHGESARLALEEGNKQLADNYLHTADSYIHLLFRLEEAGLMPEQGFIMWKKASRLIEDWRMKVHPEWYRGEEPRRKR